MVFVPLYNRFASSTANKRGIDYNFKPLLTLIMIIHHSKYQFDRKKLMKKPKCEAGKTAN